MGASGLRAGWRLLIFLVIFLSCLFSLGEAVRHVPRLLRLLEPLREGRLEVAAALVAEMQLVLSLLVAVLVMGKIERRSLGDYGLPGCGAFGKHFCQGLAWGIAAVTAVMLLIFVAGGYSFGSLALHGGALVGYAVGWAMALLLVGFFEEFLFRGYAQFTLTAGIGFWPSAVLLSLLFGAGHLRSPKEDWLGGLAAAVFGLFLCLTLRRTGDLWFALGVHFSFIYGETFIYSVPNSGFPATGHLLDSSFHGPRWLTGGSVGPEASVMTFVAMALLFLAFGRVYRRTPG